MVARRGAAAGLGGDPVPQAIVITGIVVAFAATALAVALLLRLFEADAAGRRCAPMRRRGRRRSAPTLMPDPATVSTPGGFLLVLALFLPVAGALLALALGGRHAERIALVLLPVGLVVAVAIAVAFCGADARAASTSSAAGRRRSAWRCARTGCPRR